VSNEMDERWFLAEAVRVSIFHQRGDDTATSDRMVTGSCHVR